ncbi:restriction endonuclease subunit S [uncultured Fusobacterium sp.]|jgi:restriction endonuclease S subunit|uniref:restriction endonuclease subunit S n=1 Tax=uncultured Fusobacterium sp. TaxID=159267 RepID=UPI00265F8231|nr:restriction endonuclease subunit S [uncultured Fusobacterium sp.]
MKIYSEEKWKKVRLEECAVITMGQSPASTTYNYEKEGIPFYQGNADFGDIYPKIKCYCTKPIKIANKEEILLSVRAPVGKINIANTRCCIGRGLCSIKVKENKCEMKFLYYLLKSKEKNLNERANGSTFKAINKNQISEIDFYLPNIEIQKKIVLILDKLVEILRDKKEILLQLEELSKSIFEEELGDLRTNEKNWKFITLQNICDVRDGTHDSPKYVAEGYPLITSKNILEDKIDFFNVNYISKLDLEKINKRSKVDRGDILMPMIGTIGNPLIVDIEKEFAIKNVALLKFDKLKQDNIFIKEILSSNYFLSIIKEKNRGGTQKFLSLNDIRNISIPIVPEEIKAKIIFTSNLVQKSKIEIQKSIEETQKLFDSLMEKYFG